MTGTVLPLLGMVLSAAALVLSFLSRQPEDRPAAGVGPRLEHLREVVSEYRGFARRERAFLEKASSRIRRAEETAEALSGAVSPPSERELASRIAGALEHNWPPFLHRYLYASGTIGTLSPLEKKTASRLGSRNVRRLLGLGLSPDQAGKAAPVVGEAAVLFAKARPFLSGWPEALEIERGRILRDCRARLARSLPERRVEAVLKWLRKEVLE